MASYLTLTQFNLQTLLPDNIVSEIEAVTPGWTAEQLRVVSESFDVRLRKRYAAPFASPYPTILGEWLTHIVSMRAYLKRGVSSLDEQFQEYKQQHDAAFAQLAEAADSVTGLFDLPLRQDTSTTGITKGFPRAYTETSPYVWTDVQAQTGRNEDSNGGGSYG